MNKADRETSTMKAVSDPVLAAGMALMVGALMRQHGLTEFTMDTTAYPLDHSTGLQFEQRREGQHKLLIARIIEGEE